MFFGPEKSDHNLLAYAYAFEQATKHRLEKRAARKFIPTTQLSDIQASGVFAKGHEEILS